MRQESTRQLEQNAEQSALRWAQFVNQTVPDLDVAFMTGKLTPAAREQLLRLRKANDVFRFKLFDRSGGLILLSDDIEKPELPTYDRSKDGIGEHDAGGSKLHIRNQVLAGKPYVELKRENRPDRPAVYSEAYVPVLQDGKVLGVVEVYVDQVERAASTAKGFTHIAGAVTILLLLLGSAAGYQFWLRLRKQRHAEARVRYMAHHDVLSGALNRSSFSEALNQATWRRAYGGPAFSLLCIDLDRFKEVNDSLGHAAGDQVLRVATQRLKACLREGDQVARLGGDEFAILLMGLSSTASVTPLAQRIVQALAAPFELADQRVHCGGSVGIAIYGVDGTESGDLLNKADLALYRAKADGRGTFSFYDIAMDQQMQSRRELTRDLRDAIKAGQMSVHYQPLHGSDGDCFGGSTLCEAM
jgi:diguanylate cyclase (GGDEF)-like protein